VGVLRRTKTAVGMVALLPLFFAPSRARADIITEIGGNTKNYVLLFEGGGGATLHTAAATINGNIGVGGTGKVAVNGGGSFGNIDFSAPNTGQFTSSGSPSYTSLNYGVTNVATDLTDVNNFSTTVAAETGAALHIHLSGGQSQVIYASQGTLDSHGNYVFKVNPSFSFAVGSTLTIIGDVPGNVILNFANFNVHLEGNIVLQGITSDQVLFNVAGGSLKIDDDSVSGTFVDPNGAIFVSASNVYGRVFGGDNNTEQVVSGDKFMAPTPEPAAILLFGTVILGCLPMLKRRLSRSTGKA
jgi:hypothetical protein